MEGRRLSRPRWLVTCLEGLPAHKQSPIQVVTGPVLINYIDQSQHANHYAMLPATPKVTPQILAGIGTG